MDDEERREVSDVQSLFLAALEQPEEEREAFVRERSAGDAELAAEVLSLLRASSSSSAYFDGLARRVGRPERFDEEPLGDGDRVGPYRIVRLIGRGGMGAVYLAERADRHFDKEVALKVLAGAFASKGARERFQAERQILARLEHPNVCQLLDGGLTEDGAPYFVMEHVEGEPLDAYCDARQLDVRARIELFLQVCEAVQFAHRNLVVHRDIKPGNILVTDEGRVRLLDFGIAKLLDPRDASPGLTRSGERAMTPAYASPEMISGDPVTIASDVYSLGVLLYRMLTGAYPYPIEGCDDFDVMRLVLDVDATQSSRAVQRGPGAAAARGMRPAALQHALRGDLDAILSTALRKEPEARYASVQSFADDLRRHLRQEPVLAQRPSVRYRLGKFVRRNRVAVGLGSVVAVLLVVTTGLALWSAVTTSRQAREIARESARSAEIKDFVLSIFEVADPNQSRGESVTARELLDEGVVRLRDSLEGQPDTRAEVLEVVAGIYLVLGLYDQAWSLTEEVRDLRAELSGTSSEEYADALDLLSELAEIRGDYGQAVDLARRTIELREAFDDELGLANGFTRMGRVRHLEGALDEAREYYEKGLELYRRTVGEEAPQVAQSLSHLGTLTAHLGDAEEAERLHRRSIEIMSAAFPDGHVALAGFHINLGDAVGRLGRYTEALAEFDEALRLNLELLDPLHRDNAFLYNNRSVVYQNLGRWDEAEADLRAGLEILHEHFDEGHSNIGVTLANLGRVLGEQGRDDEALDCLSRALDIVLVEIPDHFVVAEVYYELGRTRLRQGDFEEGERLLLQALELFEEHWGPDNHRTQNALRRLIETYQAWGRPEEADLYRARLTAN